jgi:CubicO group peptidase (beta-lactamase class C family)
VTEYSPSTNATAAHQLGFDTERLARIGALIDAEIDAQRYDGAALRVTRHGQSVFAENRGYADRAAGLPLREDTVFLTMSVAKQFTNIVALNFVERGLLDLHMPVAELIPQFAQRGKGRVTLYQLLTHTGGIYAGVPPLPPEEFINNAAVADFTCRSHLEAVPGEQVNYSIICAHAVIAEMMIIADGGNRTFTDIINEELLVPVGMKDTSAGVRADLAARLAPAVTRYDELGLVAPHEAQGIGQLIHMPGIEVPAGGFVSTADDIARLAEMLRAGGIMGNARILSPAMLHYAARNHTAELPNNLMNYTLENRRWASWPAAMGVGFWTRGESLKAFPGPIANLASAGTFGGIGSGSTCFWIDPERDICFTLMTTGLMEDSRHFERTRRLGDMVVAALV